MESSKAVFYLSLSLKTCRQSKIFPSLVYFLVKADVIRILIEQNTKSLIFLFSITLPGPIMAWFKFDLKI